jgi:dsRNA-specific ribonuclease
MYGNNGNRRDRYDSGRRYEASRGASYESSSQHRSQLIRRGDEASSSGRSHRHQYGRRQHDVERRRDEFEQHRRDDRRGSFDTRRDVDKAVEEPRQRKPMFCSINSKQSRTPAKPKESNSNQTSRFHSAEEHRRAIGASTIVKFLAKYGGLDEGNQNDPMLQLLQRPDSAALELFRSALTTKTADPVNNLETLELIGDSVLNCVSFAEIMRRKPRIFRMSNAIVYRILNDVTSRPALAAVARASGIDSMIWSGEDITDATMEDCVESLVGAFASCSHLAADCIPSQDSATIRERILYSVERFCSKLLNDEVEKHLAVAESRNYNHALYMKYSERVNQIVIRSRKHGDVQYSMEVGPGPSRGTFVAFMQGVNKLTRDKTTILRGPVEASVQEARDALARIVIEEKAHMFEQSGEAGNDAEEDETATSNAGTVAADPSDLHAGDRARSEYVAALFAGNEYPIEAMSSDAGTALLKVVFTDPIAAKERGYMSNTVLNMMGDKLLKMYAFLSYIPKRFPMSVNSRNLNALSTVASRFSQTRGTFMRRLALVKHLDLSDELFAPPIGSNTKSYGDMVTSTFSALIAAASYLATEEFAGRRLFLAPTTAMCEAFMEPLIDAIDFSSTNHTNSVGGRAFLSHSAFSSSIVRRREDRQEEAVKNGRHIRIYTMVRHGIEFTGMGPTGNAAHDDAADQLMTMALGHSYRAAADPGVGRPDVAGVPLMDPVLSTLLQRL